MCETTEQLTIRRPQPSHQKSLQVDFVAPYISSGGDFISRRNEYAQQKTGAVQNTKDDEKRSPRNTFARLRYRSITSQGRLRNNFASHRTNVDKRDRPWRCRRGGSKVVLITENQYHVNIRHSFKRCIPTAPLTTPAWCWFGAGEVWVRPRRSSQSSNARTEITISS